MVHFTNATVICYLVCQIWFRFKLDLRVIVFGSFEAFISGLFAACASVCARHLSSLPSPLSNLTLSDRPEEQLSFSTLYSVHTALYTHSQWIVVALLFLVLNIFMWLVFTRALHDCRSVILAALINTSSNIVCSGLLGSYLFHEVTGPLWSIGVALIVIGLSCILTSEVRS